MSGFAWRDRTGREHILTSPRAIEDEYGDLDGKLLVLEQTGLASADDAEFLEAYGQARILQLRQATLLDDARRWNEHAENLNKAEAARVLSVIDKVSARAELLSDLHRCYDQYEAATESGVDGTKTLDGPALSTLTNVVTRIRSVRGMSPWTPKSFSDGYWWLVHEPETCRLPLPMGSSTFEWVDRQGHYHQLRSIRRIEEEFIEVAGNLAAERAALGLLAQGVTRAEALERAKSMLERISVLELDLERWSAFNLQLLREQAAAWLEARTNNGGDIEHGSAGAQE